MINQIDSDISLMLLSFIFCSLFFEYGEKKTNKNEKIQKKSIKFLIIIFSRSRINSVIFVKNSKMDFLHFINSKQNLIPFEMFIIGNGNKSIVLKTNKIMMMKTVKCDYFQCNQNRYDFFLFIIVICKLKQNNDETNFYFSIKNNA